jgi:vacuolar-type H+-ATPase subunit E/Vma4
MAETIESFVAKLQTEGVEAGQQAAEKLRGEARQEAETIVADAKSEAEKIVADANAEAESILARSQTELKLAARDAAMRLRDALGRALSAALAAGVEQKLGETDFLGKLLHDIVLLYSKSDAKGTKTVKINVAEDMLQSLTDWAVKEIGDDDKARHVGIDLKGTLKQAGFEYTVAGATVEVTVDSVVEVLSELVGPNIRALFDQGLATEDQN